MRNASLTWIPVVEANPSALEFEAEISLIELADVSNERSVYTCVVRSEEGGTPPHPGPSCLALENDYPRRHIC